jgi:hypothetical protein
MRKILLMLVICLCVTGLCVVSASAGAKSKGTAVRSVPVKPPQNVDSALVKSDSVLVKARVKNRPVHIVQKQKVGIVVIEQSAWPKK